MNRITTDPIDVLTVIDSVKADSVGGIDVFIGTTRTLSKGREVVKLEYEAYIPMAEKCMDDLEREARRRWNLHAMSIVHRIGGVAIGEASVVIAVSSFHRDEAFQACRYLIDRLKEIVPIWKREFFADGTVEWSQQSHEQSLAKKMPAKQT
jgi:molybdopterin synthase catalytic subunit